MLEQMQEEGMNKTGRGEKNIRKIMPPGKPPYLSDFGFLIEEI